MIRFSGFFLFFLSVSFAGSSSLKGSTSESSRSRVVTLMTAHPGYLKNFLNHEFDIAGIHRPSGKVEIVTAQVDDLLTRIDLYEDTFKEAVFLQQVSLSEPYQLSRRDIPADFRDVAGVEDYLNATETVVAMRALVAEYPELVQIFDLNDWFDVEDTVNGQSLYALQVSRNPGQIENEPKVLVIGQHHARELMTHHAVMDSAREVLQGAATGTGPFAEAVEDTSFWFVPVVNPDGLNYVFSNNRSWRKNRSHNSDGSRGVDLNRNYDFKWGERKILLGNKSVAKLCQLPSGLEGTGKETWFSHQGAVIEALLGLKMKATEKEYNRKVRGKAMRESTGKEADFSFPWEGEPGDIRTTPIPLFHKIFSEIVPVKSGMTVADIGSGYGGLGHYLGLRFGGKVKSLGYEIVPVRVQEGRRIIRGMGLKNVSLETKDLSAGKPIAPADIYFAYAPVNHAVALKLATEIANYATAKTPGAKKIKIVCRMDSEFSTAIKNTKAFRITFDRVVGDTNVIVFESK